jgi:hypothetical protein
MAFYGQKSRLPDYLQRLDKSDAIESATGGSRVNNLAEKIAAIRERRERGIYRRGSRSSCLAERRPHGLPDDFAVRRSRASRRQPLITRKKVILKE